MDKEIEKIRHSLSHIMAHAVKDLYPQAKFGMGPFIENGFYYDFDKIKIGNEELEKIEKRMQEIIQENISFDQKTIKKDEAKKIFSDQPYKLEIIKDIEEDQVSIYHSGKFIDLCSGPHIKNSKEINLKAFKLTRIAGAYFKGSEDNPMLTRIYGVAFKTKEELEQHLKNIEEAKKRDHRAIGEKLGLFMISENVGPGLILWHPKGAILKRTIENYILSEYFDNGYEPVCTPHISKTQLFDISGHNNFYKESMFPLMHMEEKDKDEKESYQIKPMNCPFHVQIYKSKTRSYRDIPIRYTELGTVYRYEKSGTLHGLTRVRGFTQDDAHVFCSKDQLNSELYSLLNLTMKILKKFEFEKFNIYLSTRPEKRVGSDEVWNIAENSLKGALEKMELDYKIDSGEGVFYGPKIDIKIEDSLKREWQCTTIQVDFNLPERFDMTYINNTGEKERPIMVHRALLGSLERFIGVLLEYHAGNLPLWVSPIQCLVIPIGEEQSEYAKKVAKQLSSSLRVKISLENETLNKRIREAEVMKIPYILVVGGREEKNNSVSVRCNGKDEGVVEISKFLEKVKNNL